MKKIVYFKTIPKTKQRKFSKNTEFTYIHAFGNV